MINARVAAVPCGLLIFVAGCAGYSVSRYSHSTYLPPVVEESISREQARQRATELVKAGTYISPADSSSFATSRIVPESVTWSDGYADLSFRTEDGQSIQVHLTGRTDWNMRDVVAESDFIIARVGKGPTWYMANTGDHWVIGIGFLDPEDARTLCQAFRILSKSPK